MIFSALGMADLTNAWKGCRMNIFRLKAGSLDGASFYEVLCACAAIKADKRIFGLSPCVFVKTNKPTFLPTAFARFFGIGNFVFEGGACHGIK